MTCHYIKFTNSLWFFGRKTLFEHEPVLEFQRTHTKKQPSNQKNNHSRRKQQTNNEQQLANKRQINIHLLKFERNVRKCFRDLFIRSSRGPNAQKRFQNEIQIPNICQIDKNDDFF